MAKYYRLKKDLPTFNEGDLFRLSDKGSLFLVDPNPPHWKDTVMAYHHSTIEHFPNILTDWFEEVESSEQRKITDPKIAAFIKFFNDQGIKFVDQDTKEELVPGDDDGNM